VKVRQAHEGDAEVIARLLEELGYPSPPAQVRERLHALSDADLVLLAGDGAGLVALHRIPRIAEGGQFARITALVVREGWRGQGVARRLLEEAEGAARAWGCQLLEVSAGRRPERDAAHAAYRAAGFADAADRSVRYRKELAAT
jgi:GNAT superfamily N-acetyltransferase